VNKFYASLKKCRYNVEKVLLLEEISLEFELIIKGVSQVTASFFINVRILFCDFHLMFLALIFHHIKDIPILNYLLKRQKKKMFT
jgi:hypothetical protein